MDRFVPRDDVLILDDALVWGDALPVMASAAWPSMCRAGLEADFLVCVLALSVGREAQAEARARWGVSRVCSVHADRGTVLLGDFFDDGQAQP